MKTTTVVSLIGLFSVLGTSVALASPSTELFFSEYIEGSSYNKALEIFNGTGTAIALTNGPYDVQIFYNGSVTPGATIALTGTVAAGDVYVLAHTSADTNGIIPQADQFYGSLNFNGDDAIVLRRNGVVIDVIGQIGFDPGTEWGVGLTSTADNTLRRKITVSSGDANGTDAFEPAVEWDGFATDTFADLGQYASTPLTPVLSVTAASPNTVVVTWPLTAGDWMLHATTNLLAESTVWTEIAPPYETNGANLQFTESTASGSKFYRLHKP